MAETGTELVVTTNELKLPEIKWNKEEIQKHIDALVTKYKGLEFDETQLDAAKGDLAAIRKVKTNLNEEKKTVKKTWNENYTVFEDDIKVMMGALEGVIDDINEQVKTFQEKQAKERKAAIMFYKEYTDIEKYTTFNDDWLLKKWESKDDQKIKEELILIKETIDRNIKIIKQTAAANNQDAKGYLKRLETQPLDVILERMSDDKKVADNAAAAARINTPEEVFVPIKPEVTEAPVIDTEEQVLRITRILVGTGTQLSMLKAYADKIGVDILK